MRNSPRTNCKVVWGKMETKRAPMRVNSTLGKPNLRSRRMSRLRWKKFRRAILPKICRNATKTRAVLKSTNNKAKGRKRWTYRIRQLCRQFRKTARQGRKSACDQNYINWYCFIVSLTWVLMVLMSETDHQVMKMRDAKVRMRETMPMTLVFSSGDLT